MRARLLLTGCLPLALPGCTSSGPSPVEPTSGALVAADGRTPTVMLPAGLGCGGQLMERVQESDRTVWLVPTEPPGPAPRHRLVPRPAGDQPGAATHRSPPAS